RRIREARRAEADLEDHPPLQVARVAAVGDLPHQLAAEKIVRVQVARIARGLDHDPRALDADVRVDQAAAAGARAVGDDAARAAGGPIAPEQLPRALLPDAD